MVNRSRIDTGRVIMGIQGIHREPWVTSKRAGGGGCKTNP